MQNSFEGANLGTVSLTDVSDDRTLLSELLVEAAEADRNTDELGEFILSPEEMAAAVELPHHQNLPSRYKGMYIRYSSSCPNQHWGTRATVMATLNVAYNWWRNGNSPTMLIGDISAKNFAATGCHAAHKTGTHVDIDIAGTLPRDPEYNREKQLKCATVCWIAIQLGFRRGLFSDQVVCDAVNNLAADKGFPGRMVVRADHNTHFHFEMPR